MLYIDCVFRAFNNTKPIAGAVSTNFSNRHIDTLRTVRHPDEKFWICKVERRGNADGTRGENAEGAYLAYVTSALRPA